MIGNFSFTKGINDLLYAPSVIVSITSVPNLLGPTGKPLARPTPKLPTAPGVALTTSTASSIIVLCFWMFAPFSEIAMFRFTPLSLSVLLANISDKI